MSRAHAHAGSQRRALLLAVGLLGVVACAASQRLGGNGWPADKQPQFLQKAVKNNLVGSIFGSSRRVEGTMCNTGVVETANSEQLHSILQDLAQMTYFRLIRVNVNGQCKLTQEADSAATTTSTAHSDGTANHSTTRNSGDSDGGGGGGRSSSSSGNNLLDHESEHNGHEEGDDESCGEVIEDDEGEAEPACALKGVMEAPFTSFLSSSASSSSFSSPTSSASSSSPSSSSFQSPLNSFLSKREAQVMQAASESEDEQECAENVPEFWLDMCSDFEATTTYNLQLNPEQWTGYNGSAVWQHVYEENCFQDNVGEPMCFEEKVMYRLLSGMHASINIHISKFFFPPSKRKGRLEWTPNPARFMEQYGQNPEKHLQNLHFAFLVLLRAVQKASNYLYYHDYRIAGVDWPQLEVAESAVEEIKTQQLMRRLLDSGILTSCSQVFSAFDERLLFRDDDGDSKHNTLKRSFKGVFSNISSLLNCVTCHKCRLHGKIQLMGLGAALKILLVPESYVEIAVSRDDLVALFNTLAKFSSAITYAKELAALFWTGVEKEERLSEASNRNKLRRFQEQATANNSTRDRAPMTTASADTAEANIAAVSLVSALSSHDAVVLGLDSVAALAGSAAPLPPADEDMVVDQLMDGDAGSLALAKTFARRGMHRNFVRHVLRRFRERRQCAGCALTGAEVGAVAAAGDVAGARRAGVVGGNSGGSMITAAGATTIADRSEDAGAADVDVDVVVVGGGLAGLTAALTVLDAGYRVALLEKTGLLGGNSAWASSGVNGVDVAKVPADSVASFTEDVVRSSRRPLTDLVTTLTSEATDGLHFLRDRVGFNLSHVGQLGGHSHPRTHRPTEGLVGQEIIMAMSRLIKAEMKAKETQNSGGGGGTGSADSGSMKLLFKSRVRRLLMANADNSDTDMGTDSSVSKNTDAGLQRVAGVEFVSTAKGADPNATQTLRAHFVLLATGGYANDHTPDDSLLDLHRPDLAELPTTNNKYSTGDGIKLARTAGAALTDMDQVQVHPTGFIDPKHPAKVVKTLCAEILRGVGAVLLHPRTGRRFVDELGTRDHITSTMLHQEDVAAEPHPAFVILLNPASAAVADKHVPLYSNKGLLRRFDSLDAFAAAFNLPPPNVAATIRDYRAISAQVMATQGQGQQRGGGHAQEDASTGGANSVPVTTDEFGKQYFHNMDGWADPSAGPFYAGYVTPVVHYTMGGVTIDSAARVQQQGGSTSSGPVRGLYAAGEVVGGIHGENRLGGNALTEALVFGRVAAKSIIAELTARAQQQEHEHRQHQQQLGTSVDAAPAKSALVASDSAPSPRVVSREELAAHVEDAWVLIGDTVYDFRDFVEEHPAGPEAIEELAGGDGSRQFLAVHTMQVLDDFDDAIVGKIEASAESGVRAASSD